MKEGVRVKNLQIIFFINQGRIYPFLKEEDSTNKEYYQMREQINYLNNSVLNEEDKRVALQNIRIVRYLNFLSAGFSYEEMNRILYMAQEKLMNRESINGIEELFEEKDALKIANVKYHEKNKSRKLSR